MPEEVEKWLGLYFPRSGRGALSFTIRNQPVARLLAQVRSYLGDTPAAFELYERARLSEENARIFQAVEKICQRKLVIFHRPVANFAPKYTEFKIFFESNAVDDVAEHVFGFGQSFTNPDVALSKALGELIERYTYYKDWKGDVHNETAARLGHRALMDENQAFYTSWQHSKFPYLATRQVAKNTSMGWVPTRRLFGFGRAYAPASRIFWTVPDKEPRINHPTSSGKAGGFSRKTASIDALLELVERDGFMCYWLQGCAPRKIDAHTVTTPGYMSRKYFFERYKLDVQFFDTSAVPGIPCVTCVVIDRSKADDPKFSFGAASGFDSEGLFDNSLLEALVVQRNHWYVSSTPDTDMDNQKDEAYGFFLNTTFDQPDLSGRLRYWRGNEREQKLAFWLSGSSISFQQFIEANHVTTGVPLSQKETWKRVRRAFAVLASEYGPQYVPYMHTTRYRLTTFTEYHVVSAIVPGLYPLYLVEFQAPLDIMKVCHWSKISNSTENDFPLQVTNFEPHPFP